MAMSIAPRIGGKRDLADIRIPTMLAGAAALLWYKVSGNLPPILAR